MLIPQQILSETHGIKSWNDLNIFRCLKLNIGQIIVNCASLGCHVSLVLKSIKFYFVSVNNAKFSGSHSLHNTYHAIYRPTIQLSSFLIAKRRHV